MVPAPPVRTDTNGTACCKRVSSLTIGSTSLGAKIRTPTPATTRRFFYSLLYRSRSLDMLGRLALSTGPRRRVTWSPCFGQLWGWGKVVSRDDLP